jgi:NADPH2:quinone reductase
MSGSLSAGMEYITLGLDVCGTVSAVGPQVTNFVIGEQVLVHGAMQRQHGGFAEYSIQDAATIVRLPKELPNGIDALTLAGTPCAAWTAYRVLFEKLRVAKLDSTGAADVNNRKLSLAIIGASGGVGSFALQLARLAGIGQIIGVCSTANLAHCMSLGATEVIDYKTESIHDGIMRVTAGKGIDLLIDNVGSDTCKEGVRCLKFNGIVCPVVSFAEGDLTVTYLYLRFTVFRVGNMSC